MGKDYTSMVTSVWTTGAGIAIGTNCDVGGVMCGSVATTVTLKAGPVSTDTILVYSGGGFAVGIPIAATGPMTATSSGGNFSVIYRSRPN